jgi:hypothetical protein
MLLNLQKWCNPNFTRDLEEEIGELREQFLNAEFIIMCDMNSRIGMMQINQPHVWQCFKEINKDTEYWLENRVSEDLVCNAEGRKLTEFCERNVFEILNGKYGEDTKVGFTFVSQIGKSVVDYALMSEGLLLDLVDLRIGEEVISCH